jgi:GT2 family glycosyltransferase
MLTYSVVICTLDRIHDLKQCVLSWLNQKPLPFEIIVVHGRTDGNLEEPLRELVSNTGVGLCYLRMHPSLVRQRNAGARMAMGDVVFFADDDAVYLTGYAQAILEVYHADSDGTIGGVGGTISNMYFLMAEWGLRTFFMLPRQNGQGALQPSGWPAFLGVCKNLQSVEVFSGPAMSFRKKVLREYKFDEALADYWMGDDFEMAYRVSRKYKLFQTPDARLMHYSSPAGRDSMRRQTKMMVINHYYLSRKLFGTSRKSFFYWVWSEIGQWLLAVTCILNKRGLTRFLGMIDGCRELGRIIPNRKVHIKPDSGE